jgi:hypothetical protein
MIYLSIYLGENIKEYHVFAKINLVLRWYEKMTYEYVVSINKNVSILFFNLDGIGYKISVGPRCHHSCYFLFAPIQAQTTSAKTLSKVG